MENFKSIPNPMSSAMGGFEEMQRRQQEFLSNMLGGFGPTAGGTGPASEDSAAGDKRKDDDLDEIKKQLAELQSKLADLKK